MSKTLTLLLAVTLTFFSSCSKAPKTSDKPVVRIGVIIPLSGNLASVGESARDGAQLALQEIPKDSKYDYQLFFEDDGLEPKKVAIAAQKLINVNKVDAILSNWSYGGAVVAPLATKHKIINIAYAWDNKIIQSKYNFLNCTPPSALCKSILEGLKKLNLKKAALLVFPESGSLYFGTEFERLAPIYGITVVHKETIPWEQKDFRTVINKFDQLNPDVYVANMVTPHLEIFDKQLKDLKVNKPLVVMTGYDAATDIKAFEGRWYVSDSTPSDEFSQKFKAAYHTDKVYGPGQYYESVRLLVSTYESFDTKPTPEQVADKLATLKEYSSIFGPAGFEKNVFTYEPLYIKIKNGVRTKVTLEELP